MLDHQRAVLQDFLQAVLVAVAAVAVAVEAGSRNTCNGAPI
jgi:hypothetical protein